MIEDTGQGHAQDGERLESAVMVQLSRFSSARTQKVFAQPAQVARTVFRPSPSAFPQSTAIACRIDVS